MPSVSYVALTGNRDIDGLLSGLRWGTTNLSYSFPGYGAYFEWGYGQGEPNYNFEPFSAQQRAVVRQHLGDISAVTNLSFFEASERVTQTGDLRYGMSDYPDTAHAYYPSLLGLGGDSWYNNSSRQYDDPGFGNYAYLAILHETGHALGLKHPHESGTTLSYDHDSMEYSVMSYRGHVGASLDGYRNEAWGFAQTLMMNDIAALQVMYGADFGTRADNTHYSWSPETGQMFVNGVGAARPGDNRVFMTVWDGGGTDTYDLSNYWNSVTIDLRPGQWTTTADWQRADLGDGYKARGNVANALLYNGDTRSLIENAIATESNDTVYGNSAGNVIDGRGGWDTVVLAGSRSDYLMDGTSGYVTAEGFGVLDSLLRVEYVRFENGGAADSIENIIGADDFRNAIGDGSKRMGALWVDGAARGRIEAWNDTDVFAITLQGGRSYSFELRGLDLLGGNLADSFLELRDAGGNLLAMNDNHRTRDAHIDHRVATDGTYYLYARSSGGTTGVYTITATLGDDYRDRPGEAAAPLGSIAAGETRSGEIETGGDADIFQVTLQAGRSYVFDLRGSFAGSGQPVPVSLELWRGEGALSIGSAHRLTGEGFLEFTAAQSGPYYLRAALASGDQYGAYTLRMAEGDGDDFRDTRTDGTAALGLLDAAGSVSGRIGKSGDADLFAVRLVAGQGYSFDLRGVAGGGGTLADGFLELRDANNALVGRNDNGTTRDAHLEFTAAADGIYYLKARGVGSASGSYTLAASAQDDFADSRADATRPVGALVLGTPTGGEIGRNGDADLFAVQLQSGTSYEVRLDHGGIAGLQLRLSDPAGGLLATGLATSEGHLRLILQAPATGPYDLLVSSPAGQGHYSLTALTGVTDDYANSRLNPGQTTGSLVADAATVRGWIETPGDADVFLVSLQGNRSYRFDLQGRGGADRGIDGVLELQDAAGQRLMINDLSGSPNAVLEYTPSVSGPYYLRVRGADGNTGSYALSATSSLGDDYRDSWDETSGGPLGQVRPGGSVLGRIESGADRDFFAVTLQAGRHYSIDLRGDASGGPALWDPYLLLLDASGRQIAFNDDYNGANAHIAITASTSGTYYIGARAFSGGDTGGYRLSVSTSNAAAMESEVDVAAVTAPKPEQDLVFA